MWNKWSTWILSRCFVWTVLMICSADQYNKKYQNIINIMNHSLSLSLFLFTVIILLLTLSHTQTHIHVRISTHRLIAQPKSLWVPSCCFLLRLLHSLCLFFSSYKLSYLFLFLFFLNSDVLMSLCSLQKSAVSTTVTRQTHLGCLHLRLVQHQELLELVSNAS